MLFTLFVLIGGVAIGLFVRVAKFDAALEAVQHKYEIAERDRQAEQGWAATIQKDALAKGVYIPRVTRSFSGD